MFNLTSTRPTGLPINKRKLRAYVNTATALFLLYGGTITKCPTSYRGQRHV